MDYHEESCGLEYFSEEGVGEEEPEQKRQQLGAEALKIQKRLT